MATNAIKESVHVFSGKRVLVVDDDISILKLMSHTLRTNTQAIITQAKDGQQAVEACEKEHFDLILTDIQMPVLDGFGEVKCIRAMEHERGLARKIIIGISANTQVTFFIMTFLYDPTCHIISLVPIISPINICASNSLLFDPPMDVSPCCFCSLLLSNKIV